MWSFQGYQKNRMWNFWGLTKNEVEFPRKGDQEKIMWNFQGSLFFTLEQTSTYSMKDVLDFIEL